MKINRILFPLFVLIFLVAPLAMSTAEAKPGGGGGGGGGGGSCPQIVSCPSSLPGYPTFMYGINNCVDTIRCWYRQSAYPYQTAFTDVDIPENCPDCCGIGYCPNERCNIPTYSKPWTCDN